MLGVSLAAVVVNRVRCCHPAQLLGLTRVFVTLAHRRRYSTSLSPFWPRAPRESSRYLTARSSFQGVWEIDRL
eukprot:scaffold50096_cov63-Phaeocystis_antarctica.AAC.5